jgi:two-component system response regulator AtoC
VSENLTESARILVVSRDPSALRQLWAVGEAHDWRLETADGGWEALEQLESGMEPNLVLLDLARGDADGLHTLRWLRRVRPELPILLLSYSDDAHQKMEAIRLGAQEYLVKPFKEDHLEMLITHQLASRHDNIEREIVSDHVEHITDDIFFVAASPVMHKLRAQAELLAQVNGPLLIVGERGSGKETVARLIHKLSVRSGFRFLKVNCAALPGDMLEGELFGFEKGAFAGAMRAKAGKFELCEKGTILLDNITEMPAPLQAKLLHVLHEKQYFRVGSETRIDADVRIMAATDVNIEQALAGKKLREDLYYSLSAFMVHVPPLRQRRDETSLLLGLLTNQLARHYGLPPQTFSPALMEACQSYPWPGNLRELESFVKRYLVTGDEEQALSELEHNLDSFSEHGQLSQTSEPLNGSGHGQVESEDRTSGLKSLVQSVKGETERNAIITALEQTRWNRKAAARLLQVSYRTLLYKIQQYHMSPPGYVPTFLPGNGTKGNGHGR